MRCGRIPAGDSLFRHIFHPVAFNSKGSVFLPEKKAFHLKESEDGKALIGSLVWQRYVPTENYLHNHGCRIAHRRNQRAAKKSVYCGAYELKAAAIRALVTAENLAEVSSCRCRP